MTDPRALAALLREVASYLRLEKEPHRARAYERGAAAVEAAPHFQRLLAAGTLQTLPGIGASLAWVICDLAESGTTPLLERLRSRWPPGLSELIRVPGLGIRRARVLHEALGIESVPSLVEACRAGRVRALPGFGERSELALLEAATHPSALRPVTALSLPRARELAEALAAHLRASPVVESAEIVGDLRRWQEVIPAIELAAATSDREAAFEHLGAHPMVARLTRAESDVAHGVLFSGTPMVVHASPRDRFGSLLAEATGHELHVQALRKRAAQRGSQDRLLHAADEEALYGSLDLPWLPPEVRDGTDEVAVADAGGFAEALVRLDDVRGAVHCHTTDSDGKATIEEMAQAAEAHGLEYLTITDHSQSAHYARGLSLDGLRRQWDEIDDVQTRTSVRILKGTEADILADGALDWPDAVLERLDVVIASIHQRHKQDEARMTKRLLRAIELPVFKIWGHPLGRIVLHREPIACRLDEVLDAVARSPAAIELNGDPYRLDLAPELVRSAAARGIRFVLSSDAHSTRGLGSLRYAVHMARRARLVSRQVLNCLDAEAFATAVRPVLPQATTKSP
jgi:DNA polymerase (family 10)